jgi:hypothetical protein
MPVGAQSRLRKGGDGSHEYSNAAEDVSDRKDFADHRFRSQIAISDCCYRDDRKIERIEKRPFLEMPV